MVITRNVQMFSSVHTVHAIRCIWHMLIYVNELKCTKTSIDYSTFILKQLWLCAKCIYSIVICYKYIEFSTSIPAVKSNYIVYIASWPFSLHGVQYLPSILLLSDRSSDCTYKGLQSVSKHLYPYISQYLKITF